LLELKSDSDSSVQVVSASVLIGIMIKGAVIINPEKMSNPATNIAQDL
jgi:hypothetical protein